MHATLNDNNYVNNKNKRQNNCFKSTVLNRLTMVALTIQESTVREPFFITQFMQPCWVLLKLILF